MELQQVKNILEALLLSADKPMDLRHLEKLFEVDEDDKPSKDQLEQALQSLEQDYQGRGMALTEVSSGYRIQVREDYAGWVGRLWEERVPRYSRALLETLVLIAYRQPITRGEIEEIRGVSVSSQIMKTLQEREWVRVLGHKDVPGKPSMYGTTSSFLDYFNLKSLDELPPLSDIKDLDQLHPSLQLDEEQAAKGGDQGDDQSEPEATAEAEIKDGSLADDSARGGDDQVAHFEAEENMDQAQDEPAEPESPTPSQDDAEPVVFEAEAVESELPDHQQSDEAEEVEMGDETLAEANDDDAEQDLVRFNGQSQDADDVDREETFEEKMEQPAQPAEPEQLVETNDEDEQPLVFESQPKLETDKAEAISNETEVMVSTRC